MWCSIETRTRFIDHDSVQRAADTGMIYAVRSVQQRQ